MWEESQLIVARINGQLATEATILNAAIGTAVSAFGKDGGKKAQANFAKMVKGLVDGA